MVEQELSLLPEDTDPAEKELKQPEMYRNLLDAAEADQADDELVPARAVLSNAYGAFVPLSSKC